LATGAKLYPDLRQVAVKESMMPSEINKNDAQAYAARRQGDNAGRNAALEVLQYEMNLTPEQLEKFKQIQSSKSLYGNQIKEAEVLRKMDADADKTLATNPRYQLLQIQAGGKDPAKAAQAEAEMRRMRAEIVSGKLGRMGYDNEQPASTGARGRAVYDPSSPTGFR
jgi:hypothetical protein